MRNLSNEESLYVSGGEYYPIWQMEEINDVLGSYFDDFGFDDGYGWGTKSSPNKPTKSEMASIVEELRKSLPEASIVCEAKANNQGPNGSVLWEIKCTVSIKSKG